MNKPVYGFPRDLATIGKLFSWGLYEWATSSFFAVIVTFVFAAYFTSSIAPNPIVGTHLWGNTIALSGLGIAICSPIVGAIADYSGRRKIWLFCFTILGVVTCGLLWFAYPHERAIYFTLAVILIANFALEIAVVFYNAMLIHIAPNGFLGRISGWSWGMGYLGGLSCLIFVLLAFVLHPPLALNYAYAHIRIIGPVVALWILLFSLPLFLFVTDKSAPRYKTLEAIGRGLQQLKITLQHLHQNKNILLYLIARMIYTDGLNTLFAFGGIYAAGTFGMSMTEVMQFGIALNVTAGIGAITFAWLDDWIGSKKTIYISLVGLFVVGFLVLTIHGKFLFWIIAPWLGIFVGPSQAASRTLMARLSPPEHITEMFGLYALSGKATAFIGPWLLGLVTLLTNSQRLGMATILLFFLVGGFLLKGVKT